MNNPITQSFRFNIRAMKILGWYPKKNNSVLSKTQGYILFFFLLVLFLILVMVNIVMENSYDYIQVLILTEVGGFFFKVLPFLMKGSHIKKCIHYFDKTYFAPRNDPESKILNRSVQLCQKFAKIQFAVYLSAEIIYALPAYFLKSYGLPAKIWVPAETRFGSIMYYIVLLYITAAFVYSGLCSSLIDPLVGGLLYHVTSHLRILKFRIQNPYSGKNSTKKNLSQVIYTNLTASIEYHNTILRFVDEYQKCFSWVILSQIIGTTLGICTCCVLVIEVPLLSLDAAFFIALIPSAMSQVFFFCFFGTLLLEESNTLLTAIYMSEWYKYDNRNKKVLIILMERSKRPITVTAAKLIELTLVTFSKIVKTSYSLIAIMQ